MGELPRALSGRKTETSVISVPVTDVLSREHRVTPGTLRGLMNQKEGVGRVRMVFLNTGALAH